MIKDFLVRLWKDESGGDDAGRLALVAGGAAVGFAIGGPFGAAAFGAQLGVLAGTVAGSILFPQEFPDIEGQRLDPNTSMTSAYGDPIAIGYGNFLIGGTLVYYPGFVEHELSEEVGGKGGGSSQNVISYTYTGDMRINFCEGPVDAILKIWMNRRLVYDATGAAGTPFQDWNHIQESPGVQSMRLYLGTETQLADITEVADKGVNATPAYRGIAGAFFQNWPLDKYGGVPPQITTLISSSATEVLSAQSFDANNNGAWWTRLNGVDRWVMSGGGLWDNAAQRMVGTVGFTGDNRFPLIDNQNNFWGLTRGRTLQKFDATSLQSLGTSKLLNPATGGSFGDDSLTWPESIIFGGLRLPDGTLVGEKLLAVETTFGVTDWCVADLDSWQISEFGGTISVGQFPVGGGIAPSLIVDNDKRAWVLQESVSGFGVLNRFNPGDGTIDLTYTLDTNYSDITYDKWANNIVVFKNSSHMIKFSLDSGTETGRYTFGSAVPVSDGKNLTLYRDGPQPNGDMWIQTGAVLGRVTLFNVRDMTEGGFLDMAGDFGLGSSTTHRGFFDITRNAIVKRQDISGEINYLYLGRVGTGDLITVKDIVDDVSDRVGLVAADRDTTALTDQLHGYLVPKRMQAKAALAPLSRAFFFNPVSEDFKVKFVLFGQASVATIAEDDLGAGSGGDTRVNVDSLAEEFIQEIELPEVMELGYNNPQAEYQPQYQRSKRPRSTTNTKRKKRIIFPGSFSSNTDAKHRLDTILYDIWTKRSPVDFTTSQKWMLLSPTDVVTVTYEGAESDVALGEVSIGANNVIEFKGAADDPTVLISGSTGLEGDQGADDQVLEIIGPSEFFVLDIPPLRASDEGYFSYLAAAPLSAGVTFLGTSIIQSVDNVVYGSFGFVSKTRAASHGFVNNILGGGVDPGLWDRTNTVTVQMLYGDLASSTEDEVLDGANAILIGDEIVCFVTAVDNGDGNYTLSQLLRGRRGTEGEIDNHTSFDKVVFLDETTLVLRGMDLSQLNTSLYYKGVTIGQSQLDALTKQFTVTGKSDWGWAPVHTSGSIASDDWTIGWTRRSTLNPEWKNLMGSPPILVDDWEVDILSGPGGSVLETYTSTASPNGSVVNISGDSFFYDNNDQIADFGQVETTVTFKIYPMSIGIGRGFPAEVTLVGG